MQLVEIKKLDLVTNTVAIAEGVGRDHDTIIKLVDRNKSDLEEFGRVGFEIRTFDTNGGRQKQRVVLLNEQQTTLLITYMRNNDVVRTFKKRLVAEFFTMRSVEVANLFKPMCSVWGECNISNWRRVIEHKPQSKSKSKLESLKPR